jgi:hypothetical protein
MGKETGQGEMKGEKMENRIIILTYLLTELSPS